MKNAHPFYILFHVLRLLLMTIYKMWPPVLLFIIVLHQLLHEQISFFTTYQNFIQHYLKKDFPRKVYFFNGFTQTPHPLSNQNPLSVMKVFCRCFLNYIQITMASCQNMSKPRSNPSLVFHTKAISEIANILQKNTPDGVQHENKLNY